MPKVSPLTDRSGWLQDCNAMLISALCNLSLLVGLGLVTAARDDAWRGMKLLVTAGEGESAVVDDSPLEKTAEFEVAADPPARLGPVSLFEGIQVDTSNVAAVDAFSQKVAEASGVDGLALVSGTGERDGMAGQAATEFFGIGGYGQTFVYVVDASDSMNENGKFDRARYELLQSIEQLGSDQRYFVIFYNEAAYPMDADEPVSATPDQFAQTAAWVKNAVAEHGTNPLPALLLALSLRPDAIYFLSDGRFHPLTVHEVRMHNRPTKRVRMRQIPIHTIAFVDYSTVGLMRTISRNSGGEHRFVK